MIYIPAWLAVLEVLIIFVLPVFLMYEKIIPFKYRLHTMGLIGLAVTSLVLVQKWTLTDLGIRVDNLQGHLFPYILFTILISIAIVYLSNTVLKRDHYVHYWTEKKHHLKFLIPNCFLQEFLFRAFLIPVLFIFIDSSFMVVLVNSILFMSIHVIYSTKFMDLLFVFIEGFLLATIFIFYPNLIFITIAHCIHNYLAIFYKFFVDER